MRRKGISRRTFLGSMAATSAACFILPRHVLGGTGHIAPSETITRGVIGTGGMGMNHVVRNEQGQPPVTLAVCDVDKDRLARGMKKADRSCDGYSDFRDVLERDDIDTIHIATPPHWHGLISIAAADAGYDVLSEKPMTKTIGEGQAVIDAIQRNGRMFQIGTYRRFGNYERYGEAKRLRKLIQSGLLGTPLTIRVDRARGFNWKVAQWSGKANLTPESVPEVLDYDMWLGPAPFKPYHPHRVHGSFRGYWDYDGGGLADMGQHYLDPLHYILNKDHTGPVEIEASAPWPPHPDACGMWGQIRMTYADGTLMIIGSNEWGKQEADDLPFIEGSKGKLYANYRTEPEGLFEQSDKLPDPDPLLDFQTAVRTRIKSGGAEESSHRSCSLVNLANIAIRTGRKLQWDPDKEVFPGDEEANRLVHIPMRAPWHL